MTRQEIIDFCDMKAQLEPENEDIFKAIIKALEQEPCEDKRLYIKVFADLEPDDIAEKIYQICDEDKFPKVIESLKEYFDYETCEDCVSREQLNKLYNKYRPYLATRVCEFGEKLKELPSVKPAADNNVLTCEDCISRQAAIDCLNADFTIDGKENMETVVDYINGAFKKIKALPSITPQPFINKPCVSEGVCREDKIQVLDKIRTEIKALTDGAEPEHIWNVDVLAIIDKYKESEG